MTKHIACKGSHGSALGRAGRWTALAAALAATGSLAGACAAGSGGGRGPVDAAAAPTRHVLRFQGHQPVEITNEGAMRRRTVEAPPELVWSALGGVYVGLDIPVTVSDDAQRTLGNMGYTANRIAGNRMSRYLDCGSNLSGPRANQQQVTLTVISWVVPEGDGAELVTFLDAYAKPRAVSGNAVHCQSSGRLEELIGQRVAEALGVGPAPPPWSAVGPGAADRLTP